MPTIAVVIKEKITIVHKAPGKRLELIADLFSSFLSGITKVLLCLTYLLTFNDSFKFLKLQIT